MLHLCNICGKVSHWASEWSSYSSLFLDEYDTSLVPRVCSVNCRATFRGRLSEGLIKLPTISFDGYSSKLKRKQVGYDRQPDQKELAARRAQP